jgi:hypothetical protein
MRKILLSMMALVLVIGLLGTGIVALFWDLEVSKDNNFEGGVLDLKVDAEWSMTQTGCDGMPHTTNGSAGFADDPNVWAFNVSCMAPCDEGEVTFSLTNEGCIGGLITMNVTPYTEGEGVNPEPETAAPPTGIGDTDPDAELDEQLFIRFWHDLNGDNIYAAGSEPLIAEGKVKDVLSMVSKTSYVVEFGDYMLDCLATTWIGFEWLVQDHRELSNEIMGDWLNFDIEFYLTQRPCGTTDFDIYDKRHDPTMMKLSTNMICFDICNNGTAAGVVVVDLDIDTSPPYSDSMGVPLAAGECKYLCFNWTPSQVGNFTITLSIPGDSEGPNAVEVIGAPATFDVINKQHPSFSGSQYIPVTINCNVTNIGDYAATKGVTLTVAGATSHSETKSMTLNPAETKQETFTWNPAGGGLHTITISTPDDTMGPQYIQIGVPTVGSTWNWKSSFANTTPYVLREQSYWTYTMGATGVVPADASKCIPAPPALVCARIDVVHNQGNVTPPTDPTPNTPGGASSPWRKPSNCPFLLYYYNTTVWPSINPADGQLGELVYRSTDIYMPPVDGNRNAWIYSAYAPVSGWVGQPYAVGNSWNYHIHSGACAGDTYPHGPACTCLSTWDWDYLVKVVAANVMVTVPAGTFPCYQIETYCDWNVDAVFDQSGNPATDELTTTTYWSPSISGNVKVVDILTHIPWEMASGAGPGVPPVGPPSEAMEINELVSLAIVWS